MEHGEYDLALTLLPIDGRVFNWEKVVEEELILAVPSSHPALPATATPDRKHKAVDAKVLQNEKLVMLTDTQFMQKQLQNILIEKKISIQTAAIVKSLEAQIEFVKAGIGMALMPSGIERFCNNGSVTFYSFIDSLPKREVVVMWQKDRKLSKAAMELKDVIHSIEW